MTKRLIILLIVLCVGFGATFAVPKQAAIRQTAMPGKKLPRQEFGDMTLPTLVGKFVGGPSLDAGNEERTVLSDDTGFSKRQYSRRNYDYIPQQNLGEVTEGGNQEIIIASVVTAGSDMGNSIHRPERCMTAQGHNLEPSKELLFNVNGQKLPVTKIHAARPETRKTADGQTVDILRHTVLYYWFVGTDSITNSHFKRTVADLADRMRTGTDQEWAYASISIPLDPQLHYMDIRNPKKPEDPVLARKIDDKTLDADGFTEADRLAAEFIKDFVTEVVDERQIKNWNR